MILEFLGMIGSLIYFAMGGSSCPAKEYVTGGDAFPFCADFDCA